MAQARRESINLIKSFRVIDVDRSHAEAYVRVRKAGVRGNDALITIAAAAMVINARFVTFDHALAARMSALADVQLLS